MRLFIALFILLCSLFAQLQLHAEGMSSPIIRYNVPILQNASPSQCQAARRGQAAPEEVNAYTGAGGYSGSSGPGVRSCTGCTVDPSSQNCICRTCYYYFN